MTARVVIVGLTFLSLLATNCTGAELFSSLPDQYRRQHLEYSKQPAYLECQTNGVTVFPGGAFYSTKDLRLPDNKLREFLEKIETNAANQFVVVLERPGSFDAQQAVYNILRLRRVEAGHELLDATTTVTNAVKEAGFIVVPLAQPLDKKSEFFECRNNAIFYVDKDKLGRELFKFTNRFRPLARLSDIQELERALEKTEFGDTNYVVDTSNFLLDRLTLRPRPAAHGEGASVLKSPDSLFQLRLQQFDSRKDFIMFLVRDDGREIFRTAREIVDSLGFEWCYRRLGPDEPLEFSQ